MKDDVTLKKFALQLFMITVGAILTAALIPTFLILLLKALSAVAHP